MSDQPEDDPIAAETARLLELLGRTVRNKGGSIRSLEKKMGVGDSVFAKLLKGKITLQVRHVLMLCQAAEIEPKEFFAAAYGFQPAPAPVIVPEPPPADPSQKFVTQGKLEEIFTKVFVTAKVLTPEQAADVMAQLSANDPED